jgi:hypothetical protein
MPRTTFTADNKAKSNRLDYPVLKLAKGEHARVVVMEVDPITEFVHNIEAPILDDQGRPVMETRNYSKSSREVMSKSFVGRHKCFGRFEVLREKQIDPEVCPTCKAAKDGEGIEPPTQRFVVHVFQYATKPGTFTAQEPLSGKLVAWALSSKRWNELVDMAVEHGEPDKPRDIRTIDLLLGPCENEGWQKYEIKAGAKCRWMADKVAQKFVSEVYRNNRAQDLTPLIAPEVSLEQARSDIRAVQAKYDVLNGRTGADTTTAAEEAGVGQAVDDILGEALGGQPAETASSVSSSADEASGDGEGQSEEGTPGPSLPPPVSEFPSEDDAKVKVEANDFDDILAAIDSASS